MSNSTQDIQVTDSKLAYVAGIVDTLSQAKLANWSDDDVAADVTVAIASKLAFDPLEVETDEKIAGELATIIIKMAEEMCAEEEKNKKPADIKKEREAALKTLEKDEEKKAAVQYWGLCDKAQSGLARIKRAMQGIDVGTPEAGANSLSDAAAHDSIAKLENEKRPSNYAAGAPTADEGGELGQKGKHPKADEVGKTAQAILNALTKEAMQGTDVGTPEAGANSFSDAAAHDSIAKLENEKRPANYAAGAPTADEGGELGQKGKHPKADEVGKTAKARFEETAKLASMHPVYDKLTREEKIDHCKAMMDLPLSQKRSYLNKLSALV